ncbi:MAG: ABC transporter permease subunit [Solirubrobacteraceae bacterium]|jgi:phosphate transport system permease protein
MASVALSPAPDGAAIVVPPRGGTGGWPFVDRVCYWLCWATGVGMCLIAVAIVLYMFLKGISYLHPSLFIQSPAPSLQQSQSGGFRDPLIGTFIVTVIGTAIAAPTGVAIAAWLSEYGRPSWLARTVESAVEMLAGVPSIVLALFGLLIFSQGFLGFLSQGAAKGALGESFFNAGAVMSLLALPLVVASTREALAQVPDQLREASYALGKARNMTIRRVLLPAIRPSIASGVVLGMGRIIGDTAIVTVLLGVTLKNEGVGHLPIIGTLRGTGSTLTSYVYNNSPAGEGNAHEKAYAAAFVLLVVVLLLNALVTRLTTGAKTSGEGMLARFTGRLRRPAWIR